MTIVPRTETPVGMFAFHMSTGLGLEVFLLLLRVFPSTHVHPLSFVDDLPVQPLGQVEGSVQPSHQPLQQPGAAAHLRPAETVSLTVHTQGETPCSETVLCRVPGCVCVCVFTFFLSV